MEGMANDFVIDHMGELVLVDPPDGLGAVTVLGEGTVLAVVTEESEGDLAVQMFGSPSKEVVSALYVAMLGLRTVMIYH